MIKQRKVGLYIFLNIITLGIYGIFFWHKWTEDINKICDGDEYDSADYLLVLILDLFSLGIYTFVWNYQMGERMYQKAADYGVSIKHGGIYVMLWLFIPFVSSGYKIKYINKLAAAYNATVAPVEEEKEEKAEEVEA